MTATPAHAAELTVTLTLSTTLPDTDKAARDLAETLTEHYTGPALAALAGTDVTAARAVVTHRGMHVGEATATTADATQGQTWTIFGHWQDDRLWMDAAVPGHHDDVRECDDDRYPEGLWADTGTGPDPDTVFDALRAKYEAAVDADYDDDTDAPLLAALPTTAPDTDDAARAAHAFRYAGYAYLLRIKPDTTPTILRDAGERMAALARDNATRELRAAKANAEANGPDDDLATAERTAAGEWLAAATAWDRFALAAAQIDPATLPDTTETHADTLAGHAVTALAYEQAGRDALAHFTGHR